MRINIPLWVFLLTVMFAATACTDTFVTNWDLQSVAPDGTPNNPLLGTLEKVIIEGIALNNPEDMLDQSSQWQVFVEGEGGDLGGTAAWAGKFYYLEGQEAWDSEVVRLNSSGFRQGDRIQITGYVGQVNGKANFNERHTGSPSMDFTVELLESGVGLPTPELTTIPEMNVFDPARLTGGERFQCRRIRIDGVHIISGTWGPNEELTIADDSGNELLMRLCNVGFGPMPLGKFSVIGLGNQEGEIGNPNVGLIDGYQVWVTQADGIIAIPEPLGLTVMASGIFLVVLRRNRK